MQYSKVGKHTLRLHLLFSHHNIVEQAQKTLTLSW